MMRGLLCLAVREGAWWGNDMKLSLAKAAMSWTNAQALAGRPYDVLHFMQVIATISDNFR